MSLRVSSDRHNRLPEQTGGSPGILFSRVLFNRKRQHSSCSDANKNLCSRILLLIQLRAFQHSRCVARTGKRDPDRTSTTNTRVTLLHSSLTVRAATTPVWPEASGAELTFNDICTEAGEDEDQVLPGSHILLCSPPTLHSRLCQPAAFLLLVMHLSR